MICVGYIRKLINDIGGVNVIEILANEPSKDYSVSEVVQSTFIIL